MGFQRETGNLALLGWSLTPDSCWLMSGCVEELGRHLRSIPSEKSDFRAANLSLVDNPSGGALRA